MGSDIRLMLRKTPNPIPASSVIEVNDQGYPQESERCPRLRVAPSHISLQSVVGPRQSVACPVNQSCSLES